MIPKTFQKVNKSNARQLRINEGPAKQAERNTNCTSAGWGKTIYSSKNNQPQRLIFMRLSEKLVHYFSVK